MDYVSAYAYVCGLSADIDDKVEATGRAIMASFARADAAIDMVKDCNTIAGLLKRYRLSVHYLPLPSGVFGRLRRRKIELSDSCPEIREHAWFREALIGHETFHYINAAHGAVSGEKWKNEADNQILFPPMPPIMCLCGPVRLRLHKQVFVELAAWAFAASFSGLELVRLLEFSAGMIVRRSNERP